ncbi:MAG TPA: hypothetical protein VF784_10430 [Anaerolineales bacterium]
MFALVSVLDLVLGAFLLVAGRRLFWLLVAGIGFAVGVMLATRLFNGSQLTMILAGLVLGGIFALLAIFLESVAIGIAGFLGGGYVLLSIATMLGLDRGGSASWLVFAIGGVLGILLVVLLVNWALITISSLAGASMVVSSFGMTAATAGLVYLGLVIAGILIQGTALRREAGRSAP